MNFSPRQKFIIAVFTFVAIGLGIGIAAGEAEESFPLMAAFFIWIAVGSFGLMQIRCPRCDTPVVYQGKVGKFSIYAGFVRRNCQNCGESLTQPPR